MIDIWMIFTMTYPFLIIIIHSLKEVIVISIYMHKKYVHYTVFLGVQFHKRKG